MANKDTNLLNATELLDIYGVPILNNAECREYFTLTDNEIKILKSFKEINNSVHFAICLVFFKIKKTLINFNYQDVTNERRHVMERYFPNAAIPKSIVKDKNTIARIENKVLDVCNYTRFSGTVVVKIESELRKLAPNYPRQRQLCKSLLDLFIKHKVSIPGYTTIQNMVSRISNLENGRIIQAFSRHTNKYEREIILSLLTKSDTGQHNIISIRKDMRGFNTEELNKEIENHVLVQPVFEIAKKLIPKLNLPTSTINYYSSLINYYTAPRLKQINHLLAQIYLLCYCFTRYQMLNDNLLEAMKKRTNDYNSKGIGHANDQMLDQLELIKDVRKRVGNLLIAINDHPNKNHIPRQDIYKHIPENELLIVAKMLIDDKFDKKLLFWKYIDSERDSIVLNLRNIFLTIDFVVTNDELLKQVIEYTKTSIVNRTFYTNPLPPNVRAWIKESHSSYIFNNDEVLHNRFEFLLYLQIVHHISTNKLTLQHTIKYNKIDDDLISEPKWDKDKRKILKTINYENLSTPIRELLTNKKQELIELYKIVNHSILNGTNDSIKIVYKNNERTWRFRPLEAEAIINDSIFANFQPRNIVDITHFVNRKTSYLKAFTPITPKSTKGKQDDELITGITLGSALRLGARKMAAASDLQESPMLSAEATYIRLETIIAAINKINNLAAELPIFKEWYINNIRHSSLDGLKLEVSHSNKMARHSSKFFGQGIGVSAYNHIFNFYPITSRLIGANEYEGSFAFEMVHQQNDTSINFQKPDHTSTDDHGDNAFNFGFFDLTDKFFMPRIPKPHRETFWGFGSANDYEGFIVKPKRFVDENLIIEEWDNIQRLLASLLTGETSPNIIIRKLSSNNYTSRTKKAFAAYSGILRSIYLLKCIQTPALRRSTLIALNRGEAYNNLYRAITIMKKGELRGHSEIEMEVWNQCTRLISSIILYYNSYILNSLYAHANTEEEKNYIINASPSAWSHINLIGNYQFCGRHDDDFIERAIKTWDWKNSVGFVERTKK